MSKHGKLTFTDLRVERSGGEYRLRFARVAGGLVEAVTSNFNVATGAAWRLFLKRQPGVSSITGWVLEPQPAVLLLDKGGNVVTDPSQQRRIHVTLLQHGYPVWDHNCEAGEQAYCRPAEHMSAATATSSAGVASFEGLQLHRVGSGYTMVFCDGPCRSDSMAGDRPADRVCQALSGCAILGIHGRCVCTCVCQPRRSLSSLRGCRDEALQRALRSRTRDGVEGTVVKASIACCTGRRKVWFTILKGPLIRAPVSAAVPTHTSFSRVYPPR